MNVPSYTLPHQTRCLAAVNDSSRSLFLVGTINLREDNEIRLLSYTQKEQLVTHEKVFAHPAEIWSLSSCPTNASLLWTVSQDRSAAGDYRAQLWTMASESDAANDGGDGELTLVTTLPHNGGGGGAVIKTVLFEPTSAASVLCVDDSNVSFWRVNPAGGAAESIGSVVVAETASLEGGLWDPHNAELAACSADNAVVFCDKRSLQVAGRIDHAHRHAVLSIDYNPNSPHHLVTSGDDGHVCFWDKRSTAAAVLQLPSAHSHWVCQAKYNPTWPQLLATSSTDRRVKLYSVKNISKREWQVLQEYKDRHDESVYSLAWSPADSFVLASLSYDGRMVINEMPEGTKKSCMVTYTDTDD